MEKTAEVDGLWKLPATEIVELLRQGKVTPTQLIHVAVKRIQETNEAVNATPILCIQQALEAARKLEDQGHPPNPGPGYLYGLPILVKDATAVKGLPWTEGSLLYKDRVADHNDPMVDNLERNGGVVLGKTNVPELCAGAQTYNRVFGTTRNPWSLERTAGGSSGGSAAALATGQAWLATGSDLGGSLRIPASFCGVVGMRPSQGVVPRACYKASPADCDAVNGPMARNVPDLGSPTGHHGRLPSWGPKLAARSRNIIQPGGQTGSRRAAHVKAHGLGSGPGRVGPRGPPAGGHLSGGCCLVWQQRHGRVGCLPGPIRRPLHLPGSPSARLC
eukprot:jgi/Botrbrau1/23541/Bobra.0141s0012.1